MFPRQLLAGVCLLGALSCAAARADVYPVIIVGKVTMPDGSPPPFAVSIERECSDFSMFNGPLADKNGQWVWRVNIDLYQQASCIFRAHHDGYTSTVIDGSDINKNYLDATVHVPDLILMPKVPDPYTIHVSGDNFPAKSKASFEKAMRDIDMANYEDAIVNLKVAVGASPKFGEAWHAMGVLYSNTGRPEMAKEAFAKAVDANPKLLTAWITLTRTCLILKDWRCAADASEKEIKADIKHLYTEIYLHQAMAKFQLKDFAGAGQSVNELLRIDTGHRMPRAEFALGRILEAKGDLDGAREHMKKYLALEPNPMDKELVAGHLEALGKPEAADINPDLELL